MALRASLFDIARNSASQRLKLRIVTYRPGGLEEAEDRSLGNVTLDEAQHQANRLQTELEADGSPVQVYVLDATGVPIHKAGAS